MKIFIVLAAAVAIAVAAPAVNGPSVVYDVKRTKKSAYGAPCGGGAPLAPIALYLAPQGGGVAAGPHYREDENTLDEHENPAARSYYGAGIAGIASGSSGIASGSSGAILDVSPASASGPAVGLFPNAKLGGCAVPLLLSCAPNVVSGHIVKQHGYASSGYGAASAAGPSYRENSPMEMREAPEHGWAESERSAAKFTNAGNHHMNKQDSKQHVSAPAHHSLGSPHNMAQNHHELTTSL